VVIEKCPPHIRGGENGLTRRAASGTRCTSADCHAGGDHGRKKQVWSDPRAGAARNRKEGDRSAVNHGGDSQNAVGVP
jgi:hypothetical protein